MPTVSEDDPRTLEGDAPARLVAACQGTMAVRDKALVLLALASGLRRKEIAALRWRDVDLTLETGIGLVHVLAINSKTRRPRTAYLDPKARDALALHRLTAPSDPGDPVFAGRIKDGKAQPITTSGISHIVARIGLRAGVEVSPHRFRHTCARAMLAAGLTLPEVQRILGHSNMTTTARYLSALESQVDQSFSRIYGDQTNGRKKRAA